MIYLWKALRHSKYGGIDVVGFKEAERSSVLAGQYLTCFIDNYESAAAALIEYPEAKDNGCAGPVSVSHLPDENDPVWGGMYPDDI